MAARKQRCKKRGFAWTEEETWALLSVWEEQAIEEQMENPKVNNGSIYKSVSDELMNKGFEGTHEQCKVRIHTFKRMYRETKTKLKQSGKGRRTCNYFNELDSILGNRPASSPVKVIETLSKKRCYENEDESNSSESESIDAGVRPLEKLDESGDDNDDDKSCPATNSKDNKEVKDATDTDNKVDDPQSKEKEKGCGSAKEASGKTKEKREATGKNERKKARKSKLELALTSVMDGFNSSNEKAEDKFLDLERRKLDLEKQKMDMEKARLDSEERQKREERQHQYNMMQMIMGAFNQRQSYPPNPPSFATGSQILGGQGTSQISSPNMQGQQFSGANLYPQYKRQSPGEDNCDDPTYYNL
ncbi:uncharacterized protein LOC134278161 [Saccostrea cucullata]|uniref:uncharacterized protein LOC134278161 n=1 Tax=Saccostrea cuccullata TaxID=36930 RepID=UPI002ED6BD29